MTELKNKLKKIFSRKLTLMLVPHHAYRPLQVHFSISFALFLILFWTGLTSWASWAVFSNVDYWSMKANHQLLKLKVQYFATELRRSREMLDQVREADIQLRHLLQMKSRQTIVEESEGGPNPVEVSLLQKTLNNTLYTITDNEIRHESNQVLRESMERLESFKEIAQHIAYERGLFRSTPRGWPVSGRTTSHFGHRISPFTGRDQFHTGMDIANAQGTPVLATADGVVQLSQWEGGYGRLVIINHGFGYVTYYGHNSELLVKVGEKVRRGQLIAYMGSSGSSTGDHCHYEVWYNGQCMNPWKYLNAGGGPGELQELARR